MNDKEYDEIGELNEEVARLQKELEQYKNECYRQTEYGIRQHEFAQDSLREVKHLKKILSDLYDAATDSGNIYTHDGWNIRNPFLELPKELEEQVRTALRDMK